MNNSSSVRWPTASETLNMSHSAKRRLRERIAASAPAAPPSDPREWSPGRVQAAVDAYAAGDTSDFAVKGHVEADRRAEVAAQTTAAHPPTPPGSPPNSALVDAGLAQRHYELLVRAGMPQAEVRHLSRLSRATIRRLTDPDTAKIVSTTEQKLLSVPIPAGECPAEARIAS